MSKQETKQALLETGTKLIFQRGFNATGLNEVLEAANIPKGSFYYYFGSKEDFGLQVLERFVGIAKARLESYLTDRSFDPITRLRNYFDWYGGYLESIQCSRGCMIGNLGQELADQNEAFRVKVDEAMLLMSDSLVDCLRDAQAQGQISADLDAEELAAFVYNSWQGTLLRMKVTKSAAPIETFKHTLFTVILKP